MWTGFWTIEGREEGYEGDPPDGAVELLVMVFPGTAKKPVVHK